MPARLPGRRAFAVLLTAVLFTATVGAADLREATVKAFDAYVAAAEARPATPFLWLDTRPQAERERLLADLRRGELVIERLRARPGGRDVDVPDGMIHHWIGTVFIPKATAATAVRLLQDYDHHGTIYAPTVARSRLLSRSVSTAPLSGAPGDEFRFSLRFVMTKVITVVVDGEHHARFAWLGPGRARSWIRSTRLAEVTGAGTSAEREEPVGKGGGYLWRLNSYWRFEERDGGVFLECESISLTRDIPFGLGWVVGPFVTSLPRESLEFTLQTTRKKLMIGA
ncbi:MAG TPA: hypothetical protein VGQ37_23290 [Vicinamibacterales bacterium]|jgi:hypothetical protein|nr:hypothetical protein [Vicinamibacterales bacterium]